MKKKFIYVNNGKEFDAVAEEDGYGAGKAVRIKIYGADGEVRNNIVFACQSEFPEYDYYQGKSVSELIDIAIEAVCSGVFDVNFNTDENKISLSVPFNKESV